jgi:transposase-like protein
MSENVRQCPIPPKNSSQTPPPTPPPPLSLRQQAALARLLAGEPLGDIARALEIDPRTLYRWRRHHPAFTAELTRRQRELWGDLADDLRGAVADGVGTLRGHLVNHDPMTQLRAARFLVNLVNADRLRPTGATTVDGVLDEMLRESTSPPATPEHQAQRRALLDRLLADPDINPAT